MTEDTVLAQAVPPWNLSGVLDHMDYRRCSVHPPPFTFDEAILLDHRQDERSFPVDVASGETVGDLKKAVLEEIPNYALAGLQFYFSQEIRSPFISCNLRLMARSPQDRG
jgi:hypothetical protein